MSWWHDKAKAYKHSIERLNALIEQIELEKAELGATLEEITGDAYAAINPANWQNPHTVKELLTCYGETLDDISKRRPGKSILGDLYGKFMDANTEAGTLAKALDRVHRASCDGAFVHGTDIESALTIAHRRTQQ